MIVAQRISTRAAGPHRGQIVKSLHWTPKGLSPIALGAAELRDRPRIYRRLGLQPASLDTVGVDFVLQQGDGARYIIKELDILLRVGGRFTLTLINSKAHSAYFLSRDQVKYEFAVSTNGRYALSSQTVEADYLRIIYTKTAATLQPGDNLDRWTFGIITNGKKNQKVVELAESIIAQAIREYEIIICGPFDRNAIQPPDRVSVLPDVVLANDMRAPIGAKKNRIINAAQFDNVCIMHDRFLLPPDWFERMKAYGNYFDYLCLPTKDAAGRRFGVDWMTFVNPPATVMARNRSMQYDEWSPEAIIQGGIILGKRSLLQKHRLDERLHWEELEDIHFSKVAYLDGAYFYLDRNNSIISDAVNHRAESGPAWLKPMKEAVVWCLNLLRSYILFHRLVKKNRSA